MLPYCVHITIYSDTQRCFHKLETQGELKDPQGAVFFCFGSCWVQFKLLAWTNALFSSLWSGNLCANLFKLLCLSDSNNYISLIHLVVKQSLVIQSFSYLHILVLHLVLEV